MTRRDTVAEAAVELVARSGVRALTHRGVDAEAGCPPGTTSNYFRTREALLAGVAERIRERDVQVVGVGGRPPATLPGFTDLLGAYVVAMCTRYAYLARARIALMTEVPEQLSGGHRRLVGGITAMLRSYGIAEPEAAAESVVDFVDGAIIHRVYLAAPAPDAAAISRTLLRLLGAETGA
ncbi:TetR/AcrR family transcriptional regulator [Cumulibacter manganitolerans]|uniref:TetR/AcrR family transcriptional regulator n=1 Tax=Cumulibacter manganitolerans TaxID=1884992 RepID=UPI001296EF26|nr:TetR family transcriptional regulator [Cumulibacter manganitolerans]